MVEGTFLNEGFRKFWVITLALHPWVLRSFHGVLCEFRTI